MLRNTSFPLQAKEKKGLSKYDESKGVRRGGADDTPLDDPVRCWGPLLWLDG